MLTHLHLFSSMIDNLMNVRRLSIYVAPVEQKEEDSDDASDSESDSSESNKDEEANMMDQGDDGYGDMDSEEEEEEEEAEGGKARIFESGKASTTRSIRVGPPQNSEKSGRKVPPQVHLSRVEHMLHRATKNISVEMVHFPPAHIQVQLGKELNSKAPPSDVISAKEKSTFDEFDRLLGFRVRNPNPILRITSSFLGPLMRIIRIFIYATRISFNLTTWRDPYLSFWVLMFLSTVTFVLLIFPWRTFFLLSSCLLLGPQVRTMLSGYVSCKVIHPTLTPLFSPLCRILLYESTSRDAQKRKNKMRRKKKKLKRSNRPLMLSLVTRTLISPVQPRLLWQMPNQQLVNQRKRKACGDFPLVLPRMKLRLKTSLLRVMFTTRPGPHFTLMHVPLGGTKFPGMSPFLIFDSEKTASMIGLQIQQSREQRQYLLPAALAVVVAVTVRKACQM